MVPILFIVIVTAVLSLLIYWVLKSTGTPEPKTVPAKIRFHYELASELSVYGESELYVPQDTVKFSGQEANNMLAYWNLSRDKFEKSARHNKVKPDPESIVLRLYEVNEWRNYFDIKVKSLAGRCRFELQPGNYYYLELGLGTRSQFIPILTSNTVKLSRPSPTS